MGGSEQTVTLARRSPNARFVSVDVSTDSVRLARRRVAAAGLTNVGLAQADLFAMPFRPASFDHAFICFVLEHLSRPREALEIVRGLLRPGGTVTVVEGDHGSAFFHPDSEAARAVVACQVELQRRAGGDALIGRRLCRPITIAVLAGYGPKSRLSPSRRVIGGTHTRRWHLGAAKPAQRHEA